MADSRAEVRGRLLDRYGARGEALYMLVYGFLAISVNGVAAFLLKQSLLFPNLSPAVADAASRTSESWIAPPKRDDTDSEGVV